MSRMASQFFGFLFFVVTSSSLFASDPKPTIEELIDRLGHPRFLIREQAAKEILAQGATNLPRLISAKEHSDIEIQSRIEKLIQKLKLAKALEPTRITLRENNKPLQEILTAIEKQSGYSLAVEPELRKKQLTVEVDQRPFWEVLDYVASCSGTQISPKPFGTTIELRKADGTKPRIWTDGVFRIEMIQPNREKIIRSHRGINEGPNYSRVTINLCVMCEPKLWLREIQQPIIETALDDQMRSSKITPDSVLKRNARIIRENTRIGGSFQETFATTFVELYWSGDEPKKISDLQGEITNSLVIERNPIVLTEQIFESKGVIGTINETPIEVLSTKQEDGFYTLKFSLPFQTNGFPNRWSDRIKLQDGKGNSLDLITVSTRRIKAIRAVPPYLEEMSFVFQIPPQSSVGPAKKLVVEEWVVVQHPVKFEFKEILFP